MLRLPWIAWRRFRTKRLPGLAPASPAAPKLGQRFVPAAFAPPGLTPTPRVIYRTKRKELNHVKRVGRLDREDKLEVWRDLANGFIRSRPKISAELASYLLKRGFAADRALLYDLPNEQAEDYLSDLQVALLARANGKDAIVLENRVLFSQVFGKVLPFARRLCLIQGGRVVPWQGAPTDGGLAGCRGRWAHALPVKGEAGEGLIVDLASKLIFGTAGVTQYADLEEALARDGRDLLVVEDPGSFGPIPALKGQVSNRLRIFLLRLPETHIPYPAGAIYSVASVAERPELSVLRGAVSALVNLDSGRLDSALAILDGHKVHVDRLPGTGAALVGQSIANWSLIIQKLQQALRTIPMFALVQFDVALTATGFVVIDARSRCDAAEFQVHGPLMGSLRAQQFLREYGL